MPYIKTTYNLGHSMEVEKVFSGRYGKRIPNGERVNPTTEEMAKINERNAAKKLRRKIARNFEPGDYHMTLTYRDSPPDKEEAARLLTKFLRNLKYWWSKWGAELKYIKVTEYKNKRIHHHVIINQVEGGLQKIRELWKGGVYCSLLYADGGYENLANYLVKETRLTMKEMDAPSKLRYSCSRNLIEPEKHTEIIQAEKWAGTPTPPKGYWIPKDSVVNGVSERTGRMYQYYTLVPIDEISPKTQKEESDKYYKPRRKKECRSG